VPSLAPVLFAAPWVLAPLAAVVRATRSRSLDEERAEPPQDPPLVSIVIPARNESRNIAPCVESALASTYPRLEVIVVDDHSTDDTGAIASSIAARDPRLRVVVPPPLPNDWFGSSGRARSVRRRRAAPSSASSTPTLARRPIS